MQINAELGPVQPLSQFEYRFGGIPCSGMGQEPRDVPRKGRPEVM